MLRNRRLLPPEDRGPFKVMFVITSMPVGGAETLLVNLVRRLDRSRFEPELCCLKEFGPLGEVLARDIPAFEGLLAHKYDFAVWGRLSRLLRARRIDAVVTVGTGGDKMFWGRLAAKRAGVPVILSALHSTGLPDHVELPNRLLAPITDGFIGVAQAHGAYLATAEGCPASKVFVIPNGVDVAAFAACRRPTKALRATLGLPPLLAAGVDRRSAAAGEEPRTVFAGRVARHAATARGPIPDRRRRAAPRRLGRALALVGRAGPRAVPGHKVGHSAIAVAVRRAGAQFAHGSQSGFDSRRSGWQLRDKPVVAPRVGSIPETIEDGVNGYLFPAGDESQLAARLGHLLECPEQARRMGAIGRERVVAHWSLQRMVDGYQDLIDKIYRSKVRPRRARSERAGCSAGFRPRKPAWLTLTSAASFLAARSCEVMRSHLPAGKYLRNILIVCFAAVSESGNASASAER